MKYLSSVLNDKRKSEQRKEKRERERDFALVLILGCVRSTKKYYECSRQRLLFARDCTKFHQCFVKWSTSPLKLRDAMYLSRCLILHVVQIVMNDMQTRRVVVILPIDLAHRVADCVTHILRFVLRKCTCSASKYRTHRLKSSLNSCRPTLAPPPLLVHFVATESQLLGEITKMFRSLFVSFHG